MAEFEPLERNPSPIPEIEAKTDVADESGDMVDGGQYKHRRVNGLVSFFNSKSRSCAKRQKSVNKHKECEVKEQQKPKSRGQSIKKLFSIGRPHAIDQAETGCKVKACKVRQATLDGLSALRLSSTVLADENTPLEFETQNGNETPHKYGHKIVSFGDNIPEGVNKITQQDSIISQQDLMERDEKIRELTEANRVLNKLNYNLSTELEETKSRLGILLGSVSDLTIDEAEESRDEFKQGHRLSKSFDDIATSQVQVLSSDEKQAKKLQKAHSEL